MESTQGEEEKRNYKFLMNEKKFMEMMKESWEKLPLNETILNNPLFKKQMQEEFQQVTEVEVPVESTLIVTPTEAIGTLAELEEALKMAYDDGKGPKYKYKMNEVLNKQRAKQNKVAKRRAKKK